MTVLEPALVPELLVSDLDRSITFWSNLCGFTVRYSRPEERFAYVTLGSAQVMLEQTGVGRMGYGAARKAPRPRDQLPDHRA